MKQGRTTILKDFFIKVSIQSTGEIITRWYTAKNSYSAMKQVLKTYQNYLDDSNEMSDNYKVTFEISDIRFSKAILCHTVETATINTKCPNCNHTNHISVYFPEPTKPFETVIYECNFCGETNYLIDNNVYDKNGFIIKKQ